MRCRLAGLGLLVSLLLVLAEPQGRAYTHYVQYLSEEGYQRPLVAKFDLSALSDGTLYFYVSKDGPKLAANDSYEALVSHIRQALSVWDAVPTATLGVAYGGLTEGLPESDPPAGEIIFDELPPGVIGLGGPITRGEPHDGFVPIIRSQVILSNDLTLGNRPRPSFSELFFNSLVHEIGHALGLQHTLTSSAMSTDITRSTSRPQPLGADDIAGFSALYPSARFFGRHGAIIGRVVTTKGEAVHLASVVALNRGGAAVSALTAPDGTYRIEGLLPGPYQVYAHPLPPATQAGLGPADIVLPKLDDGILLPASAPFKTTFYGNTTDPNQMPITQVAAGELTRCIDFRVTPTDRLRLYGVSTYSFPGNGAPGVHPAFHDQGQESGFIMAAGQGLAENLAELSVEVLGGEIRTRQPQPYRGYSSFIRLDFDIDPFSRVGPKHLLFRTPGDIYVLPRGMHITAQPAPVIHWIEPTPTSAGGDVWSVHGVNFDPLSAVYFDGLPSGIVEVDALGNEIQVVPPPGPPGHRAIVTVYNPDGQSSALTLPDGNVMFPYVNSSGASFLTMSPDYIHAGTDRVVEIRGDGVQFLPGETVVGFGSSEVVARYVDVISPTHLRAVVSVPPESTSGSYLVSVTSGLAVMTLGQRLRTGDAPVPIDGGPPMVRYGAVMNSATMTAQLSPGVLASLFGENLTPAASSASLGNDSLHQPDNVRVTFNGQAATLLAVSPRQINLQIPPSVEPGSAELRVYAGDAVSEPMLVQIGRVSPGVFAATRADNSVVQGSNPAGRGETLALLATGLGSAVLPVAEENAPSAVNPAVQIQVGQVRLQPEAIEPAGGIPGLYLIRFRLPDSFSGTMEVSLLVDGRRSNLIELPVGR